MRRRSGGHGGRQSPPTLSRPQLSSPVRLSFSSSTMGKAQSKLTAEQLSDLQRHTHCPSSFFLICPTRPYTPL